MKISCRHLTCISVLNANIQLLHCKVISSSLALSVCVGFFYYFDNNKVSSLWCDLCWRTKDAASTQNAPWHFIGRSCFLHKTKTFISAPSFPPWWIANKRELQAVLFPNGPPGLLSLFEMIICVVKKKQKKTQHISSSHMWRWLFILWAAFITSSAVKYKSAVSDHPLLFSSKCFTDFLLI